MKIKTIEELEKYLFENFDSYHSSIEEINTFENYSLVGDRCWDAEEYKMLKGVYKILGQHHSANPYEEVFIMVACKNGGLYNARSLGMDTEKLENMWKMVEWVE